MQILLIEDNPGDVRLITEAYKEIDSDIEVWYEQSGDDALTFLEREEHPALIILDLNLPGEDGFHILEKIEERVGNGGTVPVAILTSSDNEEDRRRSYALGASLFAVKPGAFDDLLHVLEDMIHHVKNGEYRGGEEHGRRN